MEFKTLLQVFGRPWLIEESLAKDWAGLVQQIMASGTVAQRPVFDAVPGMDPRTYDGYYNAIAGQVYKDIFRVDQNGNMTPAGNVQVIRLSGPLMENDYCGAPGMQTMQLAIRAAAADQSIVSLVLYNDSPGGTVAGTHNLSREIKAFKAAKPVVSFVNKMMCSANYWIGSTANEIIADDENGGHNSIIGSIGTKWSFLQRSAEGTDVQIVTKYADKSKRKNAFADEIDAGDFTRVQKILNKINETFLASVQENRGDKLNLDQEDVFEGDIYNVPDAIKYGLVDRMGSFQYAVKRSLQLAKTIR